MLPAIPTQDGGFSIPSPLYEQAAEGRKRNREADGAGNEAGRHHLLFGNDLFRLSAKTQAFSPKSTFP